MAIVVEQEKASGVGIVRIVLWVVLLGIILAAVYYVFFKKPDAIPDLITPSGFRNTTELSKINLDPQAVLQNPSFQSLRSQLPPLSTSSVGRPNPFLPY